MISFEFRKNIRNSQSEIQGQFCEISNFAKISWKYENIFAATQEKSVFEFTNVYINFLIV